MSIGRVIFTITCMLAVYGGANFYIAKRLHQWLNLFLPNINTAIFVFLYIFVAFSLFLYMFAAFSTVHGFLQIPAAVKAAINWICSIWIGLFVYLLMFFIISDLVLLAASLLKIFTRPTPENIRFISGLIVILCTTGFISYGMYNTNQIKTAFYNIQTRESALSGEMKIVMISDLHLGAVNSERNIAAIVQGINELKPDIVCIAGDIFNDDFNAIRNPDRLINLFKSINASYGVYAVLGNHDGGQTFDKMTGFLEQSNIKLLNDEYVIIDKRLVLLGRLDPSPIGRFGGLERRNTADVLASIQIDLPIVVMEHTPPNLNEYGNKVDVILAGHTHRGQIFPANLITKAIYVVDYGHYQKADDSPHVIVTSGAGTWMMPMRFATDNEIVSITLR